MHCCAMFQAQQGIAVGEYLVTCIYSSGIILCPPSCLASSSINKVAKHCHYARARKINTYYLNLSTFLQHDKKNCGKAKPFQFL
ncbi:hypothetical protein FKM82_018812 [Ascaphus truei]